MAVHEQLRHNVRWFTPRESGLEGLKEHPPDGLGRVLGLDRAPEVKTLRRKLRRLAALGRTSLALAGSRRYAPHGD